MEKKNVRFEDEFNEMINGIYKKYVKLEVREFIEEAEEMVNKRKGE